LLDDLPVAAVDQHAGSGGISGYGGQDVTQAEHHEYRDAEAGHAPLPPGDGDQAVQIQFRNLFPAGLLLVAREKNGPLVHHLAPLI
jgi:hypothetical protein